MRTKCKAYDKVKVCPAYIDSVCKYGKSEGACDLIDNEVVSDVVISHEITSINRTYRSQVGKRDWSYDKLKRRKK